MKKTIQVFAQIQDILDERLQSKYHVIDRDDYMTVLYYINSMDIIARKFEDYKGYVYLNINNKVEYKNGNFKKSLRQQLGRKKINGKMVWIIDQIIKDFLYYNILERSKNYIPGEYSYGYKISNDLLSEIYIKDLYYREETIEYRLYEDEIPTNPTLKSIYDFLKSDRVTYDFEKALQWINLYSETSIEPTDKIREKVMIYTEMAIRFKHKNIFVKPGILSNRIYTNFNTIKRELRDFVKIDGEFLTSTDLKTSQPFLFASDLVKKFPDLKEAHDFYNDTTNVDSDIYTIFLNQWKSKNITSNIFNQKTKKMETIKLNTRKDAKPEFLRFMFKTNNKGGRRPFDIIFEERYPTLYKEIESNRDNLAVDLQNLESSLFLPVANKHLELGCLSVHDSLYFKKSDEEIIIKDLKQAFDNAGLLGYTLD